MIGKSSLRVMVAVVCPVKGWGAGLDLGLDFDFPDGLAIGVAYLGEDALFESDRWMVEGLLGAKLRNHLDSGDPFISLSRAVVEARWYSPALIGQLGPCIWLRAELGSRQRADLDIDPNPIHLYG